MMTLRRHRRPPNDNERETGAPFARADWPDKQSAGRAFERHVARVGSQTLRNPIKAHVFQLGGVIRIGVARSVPRVPFEMTQSGAIASRAAAVGANAGRERSDRAGRRAAHTTRALGPDRADPLRSRHAPGGGGKCARREDAASLGAFPPVAPLGLRARGGRAPTPARRPTTSDRRGDTVVVLFGVDPAPANQSSGLDADVGFGRLATEEEAKITKFIIS